MHKILPIRLVALRLAVLSLTTHSLINSVSNGQEKIIIIASQNIPSRSANLFHSSDNMP